MTYYFLAVSECVSQHTDFFRTIHHLTQSLVCVVRMLKTGSLSKFQTYDTVLLSCHHAARQIQDVVTL